MPISFIIGGDLVNDDGIKYLAMAIVLQAVQDYKKALKHNDKVEIYNLEKWFRGNWCKTLCSIDGDYLIKNIRKVLKYEKNNKRNDSKRT